MALKHRFLVETALLTHGLVSVSNDIMLDTWPEHADQLVWVDKGQIITGGMKQFIPFRDRAESLCRIDCFHLEEALQQGISGALTASGTMAVCAHEGIRYAVSCGIGGIGDIRGEELCPDLPALRDIPVALIATSPKDMLDIPATISWLTDHGVTVLGAGRSHCTGYLLLSTDVPLTGILSATVPLPERRLLILNQIPEEKRLEDLSFLQIAILEGKQAEANGGYYHPAANAAFDRLSNGCSSRIQYEALLANVSLAEELTENSKEKYPFV